MLLARSAQKVQRSADLSRLAQVTPVPAVRLPVRLRTCDPALVARHGLFQDWARDCSQAVLIQMEANFVRYSDGSREALTCQAKVRCRKCAECLRAAARMWMARAISEASGAPRTWFATLTFDWKTKAVPPGQQWSYARRQFTLFLKRLRKRGCSLRYLAVFEAHADGRPHIHCLLHEKEPSSVQWKSVDQEWSRQGFHKTRLVRGDAGQAARYVTKYLFKEPGKCRVRASIRYGAPRKDASGQQAFPAVASGAQREAAREGKRYPSAARCCPVLPSRAEASNWTHLFAFFRAGLTVKD